MSRDMRDAMKWFIQIFPLYLKEIKFIEKSSIIGTVTKEDELVEEFYVDMPFGKWKINLKERYALMKMEELECSGSEDRERLLSEEFNSLDPSVDDCSNVFSSIQDQEKFNLSKQFIPFIIVKRINN